MSGARSYYAGLAAEDQVATLYGRSGRAVCARRWRGSQGEIDLIARYVERMLAGSLPKKAH